MLAKPEYSSPPDEVCCWQGRRGRADGRECHGKEDGGTVAESYREDTAGRGALAESHREYVAGRGAEAERMAGSAMAKRMAALWQRAIGKILLAGAPWQSSIGKRVSAQRHDDIKKESDR
ncbi:MAG: hypothetical protein PUC92_00985 [bacterium]|nr:hypothetical protein [bacterium]